MKRFGMRIAREKKELTQAQLAKLCKCSRNWIGLIENNIVDPSFELWSRMAKVLETNIKELKE